MNAPDRLQATSKVWDAVVAYVKNTSLSYYPLLETLGTHARFADLDAPRSTASGKRKNQHNLLEYVLVNHTYRTSTVVAALLENGANPLLGAIHVAFIQQMYTQAEQLIQHAHETNARDAKGRAVLLHLCAQPTQPHMVRAIRAALDVGIDPTTQFHEGDPALHVLWRNAGGWRYGFSNRTTKACLRHPGLLDPLWEATQLLLDRGADLQDQNAQGVTAFDFIVHRVQAQALPMSEVAREAWAGISARHLAAAAPAVGSIAASPRRF